MTTSERIAYCTECTKKKFTTQEGIVCSLDGKKPQFEGVCPHFDGDIEKVNGKINKDAHPSSSGEIGGFLSWYLVFVGIGTIATLIFNLVTLNLLGNYAGSWILASTDIICWLFYACLGLYVIIAFIKKLPNAVTLAKIQLVTLVVINGIVLLSGDTDSPSKLSSPARLVGSIIWAIIFFIFICFQQSKRSHTQRDTASV